MLFEWVSNRLSLTFFPMAVIVVVYTWLKLEIIRQLPRKGNNSHLELASIIQYINLLLLLLFFFLIYLLCVFADEIWIWFLFTKQNSPEFCVVHKNRFSLFLIISSVTRPVDYVKWIIKNNNDDRIEQNDGVIHLYSSDISHQQFIIFGAIEHTQTPHEMWIMYFNRMPGKFPNHIKIVQIGNKPFSLFPTIPIWLLWTIPAKTITTKTNMTNNDKIEWENTHKHPAEVVHYVVYITVMSVLTLLLCLYC